MDHHREVDFVLTKSTRLFDTKDMGSRVASIGPCPQPRKFDTATGQRFMQRKPQTCYVAAMPPASMACMPVVFIKHHVFLFRTECLFQVRLQLHTRSSLRPSYRIQVLTTSSSTARFAGANGHKCPISVARGMKVASVSQTLHGGVGDFE